MAAVTKLQKSFRCINNNTIIELHTCLLHSCTLNTLLPVHFTYYKLSCIQTNLLCMLSMLHNPHTQEHIIQALFTSEINFLLHFQLQVYDQSLQQFKVFSKLASMCKCVYATQKRACILIN